MHDMDADNVPIQPVNTGIDHYATGKYLLVSS